MHRFDAGAHLAHMERLLDLPIRPQWRARVEGYVAGIADQAAKVMALDLPPETEVAPVFEP